MKTAGIDYALVSDPPAGLVRRDSPAMQQVRESLARFGYAHSEPGAITKAEAAAAGLIIKPGLTVDTLWVNTAEGWALVRGDESIEQLRRLPRVRNE